MLQVLAALGDRPLGLTLTQLCAALSLPKTTLHTMLGVLRASGHVTFDDGLYRLGPEAVMLGATMAGGPRRAFPECASGLLKDLARRTGETGILAVLTPDRRDCRYVATVDSEQPLRFAIEVGSTRPAYATGSGRAMLAWLTDAELAAALAGVSFERFTASTVGSRDALLRTLRAVRRRGVAVVDGGTVSGVASIAAPVVGEDGRVFAAISVGGPSVRMAGRAGEVEQAVAEAARQLSRVLGYAGNWPPPRG